MRGSRPLSGQGLGGDVAQLDAGLRAGLVQSGQPPADQALRVAGYEEEPDAAAGVATRMGGHQQQPGAGAAEHLVGLPVQPPDAVRSAGCTPPARPPPAQSPVLGPVSARATGQLRGEAGERQVRKAGGALPELAVA